MSEVQQGTRRINGKAVGAVGFGMLGLGMPWKKISHEDASKILKTALDHGANLWNGVSETANGCKALADADPLTVLQSTHYGTPDANSLHLMRYYFQKYPEDADKVVLQLKGAFTIRGGPDGSPEGIRASVDEAYSILGGVKTIDVFEMGRIDPTVPIEVSMRTLSELVKEGKIQGVGLSEAGASTIRRAHAIHPLSAVEIELSLFTPDPLQNGVMDACREFAIPFAAYCPLGRGWLTGELRTLDDLAHDDFRRRLPRFQPDVFAQNFKLVEAVERLADRKHVAVSQVAIGWVVRQGAIPIPGSTNADRAVLNTKFASLDDDDMAELQKARDLFPVGGQRYGGVHEKFLNA